MPSPDNGELLSSRTKAASTRRSRRCARTWQLRSKRSPSAVRSPAWGCDLDAHAQTARPAQPGDRGRPCTTPGLRPFHRWPPARGRAPEWNPS
jgi:hypothetical protein